jgi:hypothetical protein
VSFKCVEPLLEGWYGRQKIKTIERSKHVNAGRNNIFCHGSLSKDVGFGEIENPMAYAAAIPLAMKRWLRLPVTLDIDGGERDERYLGMIVEFIPMMIPRKKRVNIVRKVLRSCICKLRNIIDPISRRTRSRLTPNTKTNLFTKKQPWLGGSGYQPMHPVVAQP